MNFLPLLGRGGGRQNAHNLWSEVSRAGYGHEWLAVARANLGLDRIPRAAWQALEVRRAAGLAGRLWVEHVELSALARSFRADVVFTPMGAGPWPGVVPTVVGWHDSMVVYPESPLWQRVSLGRRVLATVRERYARGIVRRAAAVCVQTEVMADRLSRRWGIPHERFVLVPNGPSRFLTAAGSSGVIPGRGAGNPWRVLTVTTPQPAKNLGVLPAVAAALRGAGAADFEIVVTANAPAAAAERGDGSLRWIGTVPHDELGALYREADVALIPSFMESFSAAYVEAWQHRVPLVTSDLDFARHLCGDAALYASPTDPAALAARILEAMRPETGASLRSAGDVRLAGLPDWSERLRRYVLAVEAAIGVR